MDLIGNAEHLRLVRLLRERRELITRHSLVIADIENTSAVLNPHTYTNETVIVGLAARLRHFLTSSIYTRYKFSIHAHPLSPSFSVSPFIRQELSAQRSMQSRLVIM